MQSFVFNFWIKWIILFHCQKAYNVTNTLNREREREAQFCRVYAMEPNNLKKGIMHKHDQLIKPRCGDLTFQEMLELHQR